MKKLVFIFFILLTHFAIADQETDEAITKTQQMLKQPEARKNLIKGSDAAIATDNNVKSLAGSNADEQAIYELAADVLGNMKGKSPEELSKAVAEGNLNPAGFANSWTPEQKKKLSEISNRSPAAKKQIP
ncbi:MAG: hypothetical protein AB7O96_07955 [Pseudobdellovibrionaceae bacterium]